MSKTLVKRPGVGVAAFVISSRHPNCILIGKRKSKVGFGLFQLPGGHLEFGETWECGATREVFEETGIKIKNVTFCDAVNTVVLDQDYHYITIFMKGEVDETGPRIEAENMEPEKCEGWNWIRFEEMPPKSQLFYALRDFCMKGKNPLL